MKDKRIVTYATMLAVIIDTEIINELHVHALRKNLTIQAPGADNRLENGAVFEEMPEHIYTSKKRLPGSKYGW